MLFIDSRERERERKRERERERLFAFLIGATRLLCSYSRPSLVVSSFTSLYCHDARVRSSTEPIRFGFIFDEINPRPVNASPRDAVGKNSREELEDPSLESKCALNECERRWERRMTGRKGNRGTRELCSLTHTHTNTHTHTHTHTVPKLTFLTAWTGSPSEGDTRSGKRVFGRDRLKDRRSARRRRRPISVTRGTRLESRRPSAKQRV